MEFNAHPLKDEATDASELVALSSDVKTSQPEPIAPTPERATFPSPATMPPRRTLQAVGKTAVPEHLLWIHDQPQKMERAVVTGDKILALFIDEEQLTIKEMIRTMLGTEQLDDETLAITRAIVKRLCKENKLIGLGQGYYQLWSESAAAMVVDPSERQREQALELLMKRAGVPSGGRHKKSSSVNDITSRTGAKLRR